MAKPQAIDMTQGTPLPQLIRFTLPMLVGNIFQQFYSMVDAMVVGRFVGVNAFAAIGATNSVLYLMISLIIGFTVGTSVVTAQAMGAKDKEKLRAIGGLAVVRAAGLAVVLGLGGGACSRAVLRLLHTPQDIYTDAVAYLTFNFATCLAPIAYNLVSSMLRSMGDSKPRCTPWFSPRPSTLPWTCSLSCAFTWASLAWPWPRLWPRRFRRCFAWPPWFGTTRIWR